MRRKILTYGGYFERFISTLTEKNLRSWIISSLYWNRKIGYRPNSSCFYAMDYMSCVWNMTVTSTACSSSSMTDKL